MSVDNTNPINVYTANGVTTGFSFDFKILEAADLAMMFSGGALPMFTISGIGDDDGGEVLFNTPPVGANTLVLYRQLDLARSVDYQYQGQLPADVVNADFDRVVMMVQQLNRDLRRSIKVPITDTSDQTFNYTPAQRANTVIGYDADGNLIASTTDAANVIAAQAAAALAIAAAASLNLPAIAGKALNFLRVNSGETGYEHVTAAQVLAAIGAVGLTGTQTIGGQKNFTLRPVVGTATPGTNDAAAASTAYADLAVAAAKTAQIYIRDEKASGTDGGSFVNAAWRTRTLNTKVRDTGGFASLAVNQITLQPGTYRFSASGPTIVVGRNKMRLQNITDGTTVAFGKSAFNGNYSGTTETSTGEGSVRGSFTIATAKVFELQHYCESSQNTNGFGWAAGASGGGSAIEVYAEIELIKES